MELQVALKSLADKINLLKDKIETEESTKHAFVLPFITLLGYDTFNPTEVVPEFTADLGLKKGEKVSLKEGIFIETDLFNSKFIKCDLRKADFTSATNYYFDLSQNNCKGTKFSYPEVINLIRWFESEVV